nr:hypothetical protein [Tanacetum cinerariifolium]
MFVDPEISTQADRDTESEPFEDPIETETTESPLIVAPPTSQPESTSSTLVPILRRTAWMDVCVPPTMSPNLSASMEEVETMFESTFRKRFSSSYESSPSSSPPDLPLRKHYQGTSESVEDDEEDEDEEIEESMDSDSVSEDAKEEGPTGGDDDPVAGDEGLATGTRASIGELGVVQAVPVVRTAVSMPLGRGYRALRHQELALEEDHVYSTFEVEQGFGFALKPERPERVLASRQPTLTTWTDSKDDMLYIDVLAYPPPALSVKTPPLAEWTSGSLPISPSPFIVLLPISSPMIPLTVPSLVATPKTAKTEVEMHGKLICNHAVRLEELSHALFKRYDKEIGELFTRSKAVRDEIFSQRYQFRNLEHEQKRVAVTFIVFWRPVLALKSWVGQADAQRATPWHAISDTQGEN